MWKIGAWVFGAAVLVLMPASAGADETSVTLQARHERCEPEVWRRVELQALDQARVLCGAEGGLDEASLRWVHHDGPLGHEELCTLHLHFRCRAPRVRA